MILLLYQQDEVGDRDEGEWEDEKHSTSPVEGIDSVIVMEIGSCLARCI